MPEPESPVNTIILLRGSVKDTFFRLCSRAPRMTISFILRILCSFLKSYAYRRPGQRCQALCLRRPYPRWPQLFFKSAGASASAAVGACIRGTMQKRREPPAAGSVMLLFLKCFTPAPRRRPGQRCKALCPRRPYPRWWLLSKRSCPPGSPDPRPYTPA